MKFGLFCCLRPPQLDDNLFYIMSTSTTDLQKVLEMETESIMSKIDRGAEIKFFDSEDFLIKGKLGSGRFSEVFMLERNNDKRIFAGKLFKGDVGPREFIKESIIMNSVSKRCENIVNMLGIIPMTRCLVMDYYKNGSLDIALLEDSKNIEHGLKTEFPFIRRLGYILDMCRAVTDLHRRNICHRDIAMRNLLLSDDKQHVLLTDFSLSRVVKSALKRQSTLTAIIPPECAPETISEGENSNYERWYSLKSDVWSMGIAMYGIIDVNFSKFKEWQQLPSRFPTESIPSPDVFDRIDELWILILRCWNEMPEKRPQSLDLEDRIEHLIDNPLNVANENEVYITYQMEKAPLKGITLCQDPISNSNSRSAISEWKLFEQELPLSCESLQPNVLFSSNFEELESSDSLRNIPYAKSSYIWPSMASAAKGARCRAKLEQKQGVCKGANYDHGSKEFISTSLSKYISDPSMLKPCRNENRGFKFFKSLGSLSSTFSPSVSSVDGVLKRVGYCSPLKISDWSSARSQAYCSDRLFFKKSVGKLMSNEKPIPTERHFTPDLEMLEDNSVNCQIETPNFHLICK